MLLLLLLLLLLLIYLIVILGVISLWSLMTRKHTQREDLCQIQIVEKCPLLQYWSAYGQRIWLEFAWIVHRIIRRPWLPDYGGVWWQPRRVVHFLAAVNHNPACWCGPVPWVHEPCSLSTTIQISSHSAFTFDLFLFLTPGPPTGV